MSVSAVHTSVVAEEQLELLDMAPSGVRQQSPRRVVFRLGQMTLLVAAKHAEDRTLG